MTEQAWISLAPPAFFGLVTFISLVTGRFYYSGLPRFRYVSREDNPTGYWLWIIATLVMGGLGWAAFRG